MAITHDDLLHALETSFFMSSDLPGQWENLEFPGLRGRWTPPIAHLVGHRVGVAKLDEETVDSTIKMVLEFFSIKGRAFGWIVGPESTPDDLGQRLEAYGLTKSLEYAGMVLTDLNHPIHTNPQVRVRQATPDDEADVIRIFKVAFPFEEELARIWRQIFLLREGGSHHLAFLDGVEAPIAVASKTYYSTNLPIVVLSGAATLPDYRGHGAYTALLKARIDDARNDGIEAAILTANRLTSAPICAKLGFTEIAVLDVYNWTPQ